ncbi:MAG: LysM domain-containing protein [Rhodanobacter sp.]
MTFKRLWDDCQRWPRAMQIAPLLAMLVLSGCAQLYKPKPKIGGQSPHLSTEISSPAASQEVQGAADSSLATIVNDQLQHGNYAEGETALRRYLVDHPGDRSAKAILRQLTDDPKQRLGRASRDYVVRPGDSYSTLATRYLGNASLFIILARYNGSTNPSLLQVGETVHLPLSAGDVSTSSIDTIPDAGGSERPAATGPVDAAPTISQDVAPTESSEATAKRLQKESVMLLRQGHKKQALTRLDQALTIRPQLQSSGPEATSLRKDLITAFHQRAIVMYRDQHLDQAIALWDRVLIIDPNYEPAAIYRARALELKRRLKQL